MGFVKATLKICDYGKPFGGDSRAFCEEGSQGHPLDIFIFPDTLQKKGDQNLQGH